MTEENGYFLVNKLKITEKFIICEIFFHDQKIDAQFSVELIRCEQPYFLFHYHNFLEAQYSCNEQYHAFEDFLKDALINRRITLPQTFLINLPF